MYCGRWWIMTRRNTQKCVKSEEGVSSSDGKKYIRILMNTQVYQIQTQHQTQTKPKPAPAQTQIQIQTQNHNQTHIQIHPHSQKESGTGLLKTSVVVENRERWEGLSVLGYIGARIGDGADSPGIGVLNETVLPDDRWSSLRRGDVQTYAARFRFDVGRVAKRPPVRFCCWQEAGASDPPYGMMMSDCKFAGDWRGAKMVLRGTSKTPTPAISIYDNILW